MSIKLFQSIKNVWEAKKEAPKVLLSCPVSDHKSYVLFEWIEHIKKLTYADYKILLIDNSKTFINSEKIKAKGIDCLHISPNNVIVELRWLMAQCNEIARQWVINNDYDYLFILECDVFPPLNIIEHLIGLQKKVVSACYFIGFEDESFLTLQEDEKYQADNYVRNLASNEGFLFCNGQVKRVFACGTGCTLIHKSVLKGISFRVTPNDIGHADSYFYQDLYFSGIPSYVDTSIICKHKNQKWDNVPVIVN